MCSDRKSYGGVADDAWLALSLQSLYNASPRSAFASMRGLCPSATIREDDPNRTDVSGGAFRRVGHSATSS